MTLTPSAGPGLPLSFCLLCGSRGTADAILNVLFFVPVGLAFRGFTGARNAVLLAFGLSLLIEVAQLQVPGRHSSLGDLIANTAGAALGVAVFAMLLRVAWPGRRTALLLAAAWSASVAAGLATGEWLLGAHTAAEKYYAHWTPERPAQEVYTGRVLAARAGELRLYPGPVPETETVRAWLRAGAPLEIALIAGRATWSFSPIFSISGEAMQDLFVIGADGQDLVLYYRSRGARLLLDQPDLRFPAALARVAPGDTVALRAEALGSAAYRLVVNGSAVEAGLTVADTWGLLGWPGRVAHRPGLRRAAGALWLSALLAPAAWWLAQGLRPARCCAPATADPS